MVEKDTTHRVTGRLCASSLSLGYQPLAPSLSLSLGYQPLAPSLYWYRLFPVFPVVVCTVPVISHHESSRPKGWSEIFSEETKNESIPVITTWQLNERM
ncbi:2,3-bisphosphoglycerate-dependent [Carex littledalei]|uniref:2,3-bisphosphoglycerate-dependent n=1 Tax=Carex littledalei TaxID=544730 RepID=A0A833W2A2_9POAL|nr:2,3-bisphosphoglycerate-dependent [Carex littledalei]